MLAACQRGQQDFLSAKFTDDPSECRDSEARRVVTPPCTDERPRASGVSGGQSRQAFTRGSPRSRMRTCSLRRTSQDPGRALGELPSLGEGSLRPQPRARITKDTGNAGLFPLRRASFTACPALPCSAHAHPPAFHSFANASGGRRLVQDGRKGGVCRQTVRTSSSMLRGAPPRRFRTASRPVGPAVCRRGESTPHACIVHSAGDSSACCERRPDGLSPATACAGAWPCLFGQDGGLLWAGGRLALCPRSVRPTACADQGRLSVSRQDSGPSERPPRFPER